MRILTSYILAISVQFFFPSLSVAAELVYIPQPIENQETVIASHTPMVRYLAEKLGVEIHIRYEKDYNRILQLFREGKVDLVQLEPLAYVTLKKEYPQALPLVVMNEADGKPVYTCALVTSFDGPQAIREIKRPVALSQPLSTCGDFAATLLLKGSHPDFKQLGRQYLDDNYEDVALAVIRGEFETGIMKTQVARKYQNLTLKVLNETPPFPGLMIIGNGTTLSQEQIRQIGPLLLQTEPWTRTDWITGKDGFSTFSDKDFDLFTRRVNYGF